MDEGDCGEGAGDAVELDDENFLVRHECGRRIGVTALTPLLHLKSPLESIIEALRPRFSLLLRLWMTCCLKNSVLTYALN